MKNKPYLLLFLLICLILSGCSKNEDSLPVEEEEFLKTEARLSDDIVENRSEIENQISTELVTNDIKLEDLQGRVLKEVEDSLPDASLVPLQTGPLTGKLYQDFQLPKPVILMVENAPAARPQSGLEDASIIYEYLVEGGITRFAAIYFEKFPQKAGPIRSTRPYFIDLALEYNAILVHAGASPEAFHQLATMDVDHIDEITQSKYFWRNSKRHSPHNLYTGAEYLDQYFSDLDHGEDIISSRFPFEVAGFLNTQELSKATTVIINYWGGYTVTYKYNESEGNYLRFIEDLPHLMEGGKRLYAYNILIQYVDTKVKDDEGRLDMNLEGMNKALLFKDGFVYSGFWIKNRGESTQFLDEMGQEWEFNPGQTWIQVVPETTKVEYY